jgi:4-diphosphocytidyl-2C-methyl-D-erythritol kinase
MIQEESEDTKGVIRIHKSKKDRKHNGQKKKDKSTNNDLQNITHKTKDRVTRTLLKTEGELRSSGRVSSSSSTSGTCRVTLVTNLANAGVAISLCTPIAIGTAPQFIFPSSSAKAQLYE